MGKAGSALSGLFVLANAYVPCHNGRMSEFTQPVDWLDKPAVGYVVNAAFSSENATTLANLGQEINAELDGALFCPPREALHVTLLDWIAPLVDYDGADKDALFANIQERYNAALAQAIGSCGPITVHFDTVKASPSTVFIVGHDDGQFQRIRDEFVRSVKLLPGTKLPPTIIHSSLGRFTKQIDLAKVERVVAGKTLNITQVVTNFRLMRAADGSIISTELLKRYQLNI